MALPCHVCLSTPLLQAATLGSQEGAFENVRLNFSGDQGQTMRQLISGNSIRRVAMCALSSIKGKRQHLAVNHDKGKVCVCVCVCVCVFMYSSMHVHENCN